MSVQRTAGLLAGLLGALAPCVLAAPPVTFHQAVEIALEQNSSLQRAVHQAELNRLSVSDAVMRFFPNLRMSAGAGASFAPGDHTNTSVSTGLSSSVTLFDGWANVANLREARLEESAGHLDMERTRQTVVFYVISGYLSMIEAREQLRVREENLAAQLEQEEQVTALVEGGNRAIADLYQQQANVASARASLVEARRAYELSQVDLVQALQLDPAVDHAFEIPPLPEVFDAEDDQEFDELLQRAFEQRVDLQALETRLEAAAQGERAAAAGRWPGVSLSAGYSTRYSDGDDSRLFDQFDENQSGSVSLSMSLPLFDRGETSRAIERARISVENARLSVSDQRQEVALQVRRAVLDWWAAREQLEAADARVRASEQALDATRERYDAGVATLLEVTLAQADFVSATSARLSAGYNLLWQRRLLSYYVGDLDVTGGLLS